MRKRDACRNSCRASSVSPITSFRRLRSCASLSAAAASIITGILSAIQVSCLPSTFRCSIFPDTKLKVDCSAPVEEVGFTATLKIISFPFEMPPLIPPALFVAVVPFESVKGSLCCEPFMPAAANPDPNSIPLVAGMEKTR